MSGRDLLYKPPVPVIPVDEEDAQAKRVGTKGPRGREIGRVGELYETKAPPKPNEGDAARDGGQQPSSQRTGRAAYKNPYFTKDASAVHQPNQRATGMQALRGEPGITDLQKVVLPPSPFGIDNPAPALLREATELMGIAEAFQQQLQSLVDRQGKWARAKGVTPEMIRERLARLEQMIEDRREALERMAALSEGRLGQSATLDRAVRSGGAALDAAEDVAAEGTELVQRTGARAQPMHTRLAKVLGLKIGKDEEQDGKEETEGKKKEESEKDQEE